MILDAADIQVVSRPRLLWSDIDWSSTQTQTNPLTGQPLRWSKEHRLHRLHIDPEPTCLDSINTEDMSFPRQVEERKALMPCFATPAPTPEGSVAPRKTRGRTDPIVKARWLVDNRCYAPCQYTDNALMVDPSGQLHVQQMSKSSSMNFPKVGPNMTQC